MKVGITGHKGFIGSSISKKLLKEGHEVVCLDKYTRSNIIDGKEVNNYPNDLNWVLHFGASTSIRDSFENPFFTYANNTNSTLQAIKIACNCNAVLLFMSSYVYGNPRYLPIDEKHPVSSTNPYMGSKITGEEICRQLSHLLKFPLIILRVFNIYGDFEIPGRLISDLLQAVRLGNSLVLNDPDFQLRDGLEKQMRNNGIEFRRGNAGGGNQMRQPYLQNSINYKEWEDYPRVEHIHNFGWYIGNYPDLERDKIINLSNILNNT